MTHYNLKGFLDNSKCRKLLKVLFNIDYFLTKVKIFRYLYANKENLILKFKNRLWKMCHSNENCILFPDSLINENNTKAI